MRVELIYEKEQVKYTRNFENTEDFALWLEAHPGTHCLVINLFDKGDLH